MTLEDAHDCRIIAFITTRRSRDKEIGTAIAALLSRPPGQREERESEEPASCRAHQRTTIDGWMNGK
jgi:hypothetical protein